VQVPAQLDYKLSQFATLGIIHRDVGAFNLLRGLFADVNTHGQCRIEHHLVAQESPLPSILSQENNAVEMLMQIRNAWSDLDHLKSRIFESFGYKFGAN
jgi:hypothetical protein